MTDTELFEIVKGHREAWPEMVEPWSTFELSFARGQWNLITDYGQNITCVYLSQAVLMFEASFYRALIARTNVSVDKWPDGYIVRVQSHSFESPSLIEAYAAALEWLK